MMHDYVAEVVSEYGLSPAIQRKLESVAEDASRRAIEVFVSGLRTRPIVPNEAFFNRVAESQLAAHKVLMIDPSTVTETTTIRPEFEWRSYFQGRYRSGSWKHSILSLVPFREFTPVEIYAGHFDELRELHPGHHNIENGTANTIAALVRDGVLMKAGIGRYIPAILSDLIRSNLKSDFRISDLMLGLGTNVADDVDVD